MNEQVPFLYAQLTALFFVLVCIYFFFISQEKKQNKSDILFTIGYFEGCDKTKVKAKINYRKEQDHLFQDCKDALVAIGFKRKQAQLKTIEIFDKKRPIDIQSFLREALS